MFPEIERLVLEEVLRANGNKMQRTIDSLLQISNPTAPPPVPKPTDEAEPPTDPTTSQKESKVEAELQDELYAKALQAQLSRAGDPNDEQIAKELSILQKDEMIARQLQEQEITKSEIQRWRRRNERRDDIWPPPHDTDSDSDTEEGGAGEPIGAQIEQKLSEMGKEIKSGWSLFTSKITEAFTPTPSPEKPMPLAASPPPPGKPEAPPEYKPLLQQEEEEENELLSSSSSEDERLVDLRKNVELTINTQ
uniref:CUE domain-containing protein n=1 Tax=Arcella intermedia TaxID=1963864 RepID=A0A6B2LEN5_9EUKA